MNVVELTQKLVSIPSFVDQTTNEAKLGGFLEAFCKQRFIGMPIKRQYLKNNPTRFNLYLGNNNPALLVVGHYDTVSPQSGWKTDLFKPLVKDGKVYGLGAADMKGSIAAFLTALADTQEKLSLSRLGVLLYCDEEYDFQGMKTFVEPVPRITPKIIISLDGNLQITSGCRGLIEINAKAIGKSGHSSKPFLGSNAIIKTVQATTLLDQSLGKFYDPVLGSTTTNLAYLCGGTPAGNLIPNLAEFILEVRPSSVQVDTRFVIKKLQEISSTLEISIEDFSIRHDLAPWPSAYDPDALKLISNAFIKNGLNPNLSPCFFSGYIDIAMLEQVAPKVPKFVFGAGGENQHAPDESVPIANLEKAKSIYQQVLISLVGR